MPKELTLVLRLATVVAAIVIGGAGYYLGYRAGNKAVAPPAACTQEAKQCPDGSYVGRTGPNCEFASCPSATTPPVSGANCTSDAECPSANYSCEATQGYGTVYPNGSGSSTFTITEGTCKLKEGGKCGTDSECLAGLVCHTNACTKPTGNSCSGPNDKTCPSGYTCVQGCGPPVVRGDEPPPPYFCELNEVALKPKICPICLASNTNISTPDGDINVADIKIGTRVWSMDESGKKIISKVISVSKTPAPKTHQVIQLSLSGGRTVWASPGHPTSKKITVGELKAGDIYDGDRIESVELIQYRDNYTYDILPDSAKGFYWANGILLGSTLRVP